MAHPMGESKQGCLRVDFDRRLKLEFHGSKVTTDAGLLAYRELDASVELTEMVGDVLADSRTGMNGRHGMVGHHYLDITSDVCPITFVKTKLLMERMKSGEVVEIRLPSGEPLENVPRSVREEGHTVLSLEPATEVDVHILRIQKA